ncbi:hypothetical protein [Methylomonas fluvii]|nr:hypothetical protein [Methylomonas fluvii]
MYPAVALRGNYRNPDVEYFNTTTAMDNHIHELLLSDNSQEKILGYLSVVFWGFYSGQDGAIRQERALGKVALARDGRARAVNGQNQRMRGVVDLGEAFVTARISEAILQIENNNYSGALRTLNELPQLQIAFSSKVCAFIDPDKCGVIDSVIAENHPEFDFTTDDKGIILNRAANRQRYTTYCMRLQENAEQINNLNPAYLWTDRDGTQQQWRALDVERAMY